MAARHCAKFTDSILDEIAEMVGDVPDLTDPFAGVGKITKLWDRGYTGSITCIELEHEWAEQIDRRAHIYIGDSERVLQGWADESVSCFATSPTYGNRMADHHDAKDESRRNTYKHSLGRDLSEGNTGAMHWGPKYRAKSAAIWELCYRKLKKGRTLVLNISNHICDGEEVFVTDWHIGCLTGLGFVMEEHRKVETPRNRFGANGNLRVEFESVIKFRKVG